MERNKNSRTWDPVLLAEWRLLNAIVRHPENLNDSRLNEDVFVHEEAKSIYKGINSLIESNQKLTPASILAACAPIDFNIKPEHIQKLYDIDAEGAESLDTILPPLENARLKASLLEKLDEIKLKIGAADILNVSDVLPDIYDVGDTLQKRNEKNSPLIDYNEWSEDYEKELEERKAGKKYTYGDPLLDEILPKGAYPGAITTIAASTSMGKSSYVLNLINNLLERNIPCMYLSLEMGRIDTMDRLISMRCNIENSELYNSDAENIDKIIELNRRERNYLKDRTKFRFSEATDVDIHKLRILIREFKQSAHVDYAVVAIDLVTQMKNFMSAKNGSSTATAMEIGMNDLNALAKEENVHIIGVAQFRRDSDNAKIRSVEEIEYLRPGLGDIKNSGALAERSRVVLSIFRPKYYADRWLQGEQVAEEMQDIMEVQVLKNSNGGASGKILKYLFDAAHYKVFPIEEEDIETSKMDFLKNTQGDLNIDY